MISVSGKMFFVPKQSNNGKHLQYYFQTLRSQSNNKKNNDFLFNPNQTIKTKKKEKKRERRRRKNSTLLSKLKTIKKTFNGNGLKYDTYLGRLRPFTLSWPK
jgi:hypothetical protein